MDDARDWKVAMRQWLAYPNSESPDSELESITWKDGSTDEVPANYFGEGIHELLMKLETTVCISWYLLHNADDIYRVEFPRMLPIPEGPTILRFEAEDDYLTALVCESRDQFECFQSWLKGEARIENESDEFFSLIDNTDYPVREVLAFVGSGLLDHVQPILVQQSPTGTKLSLYLTSLFDPAFYNAGLDLDVETYGQSAVCVETSIAPSAWEQLLTFCFEGSIAQKIQNDVPGYRQCWEALVARAETVSPEWEARLNGNSEAYVEDVSSMEIVWGLDRSGKELFLGELGHIQSVLAQKDFLVALNDCDSWLSAKEKLGIQKINEFGAGLLDALWEEHCEEDERPEEWVPDSPIDLGDEYWDQWAQVRDPNSQGAPHQFYECGAGGSNMMRGDFWSWSVDDLPQLTRIAKELGCDFTQRQDLLEQIIEWR